MSSFPAWVVMACYHSFDVDTIDHDLVAGVVSVAREFVVLCWASAVYQTAALGARLLQSLGSEIVFSIAGMADLTDVVWPVGPRHVVSGYTYCVQCAGTDVACHVGVLSRHYSDERGTQKLAISAWAGKCGAEKTEQSLSMFCCVTCYSIGLSVWSIVWLIDIEDHTRVISIDLMLSFDVTVQSCVVHFNVTWSDHSF